MPGSDSLARPNPLRIRCANHLLQPLSAEDARLGRAALEPVQLEVGRVLYAPGQPVRHVYFVDSGLVSIVGANKGRRRMEAGMVGFDGMTSLEPILGGSVAAHDALVQSPGSALRLSSATCARRPGKAVPCTTRCLRFVHAFMVQGSHAAIAAGRAPSTSVFPAAC